MSEMTNFTFVFFFRLVYVARLKFGVFIAQRASIYQKFLFKSFNKNDLRGFYTVLIIKADSAKF